MIPAIVLAAGASARMGSPKALLDVAGRPAIECVVECLGQGGADPVIVVLGGDAKRIRASADLSRAQVVEHVGWAAGRTSSLLAGMAALPPASPGFLLALVDMPLVRTGTVRTLLRVWDEGGGSGRFDAEVLVPLHAGRRGHPILLSRRMIARIAKLGPDEPLNALVREAACVEVPVDDPGILRDFDTPEDAAGLP